MKVRVVSKSEYLTHHAKSVAFVVETTRFYEYSILKRSVWIYKDGRKPSCTCEHGSCYGINRPFEYCKHINIVKQAIKERKGFIWQ